MQLFYLEHKSRNVLHNVIFRLRLDLSVGRRSIRDKNHGVLKTVFNLYKLMQQSEYEGTVLLSRFLGKIEKCVKTTEQNGSFDVYIVDVKQTHGDYDLIMDWQWKMKHGQEPDYWMLNQK